MRNPGDEWLEGIATRMKEAVETGAAPGQEQLSVRELVRKFGYERRGDRINSDIRNVLENNKLTTDPDFAVGWIDSSITIRLDSDGSDASKSNPTFDPTHRIGSLEAANKAPMSVKPDNALNVATTKMLLHDYSQLPVMSSEYSLKGIINWESIGSSLLLRPSCEYVRDCMNPPEVFSADKPLLEAISAIAEHGYVLVRGGSNTITGIVTATDLSLQFMQLAGPFLFVGEIEGHLRHLIHGKFTLQKMQEASTPEESPSIKGSSDLTLGAYCRLLENLENWKLLNLKIDRIEFAAHLDEVRQIRNDIMHFNPDGLSPEETKKLKDFARFFENVVRVGAI